MRSFLSCHLCVSSQSSHKFLSGLECSRKGFDLGRPVTCLRNPVTIDRTYSHISRAIYGARLECYQQGPLFQRGEENNEDVVPSAHSIFTVVTLDTSLTVLDMAVNFAWDFFFFMHRQHPSKPVPLFFYVIFNFRG